MKLLFCLRPLVFTVNVTVVPEEEAVPEVEEGVSQFGTLDTE